MVAALMLCTTQLSCTLTNSLVLFAAPIIYDITQEVMKRICNKLIKPAHRSGDINADQVYEISYAIIKLSLTV